MRPDWTASAAAIGQEAVRLVEALQQSAGTHTGPECRVCPICQAISMLRQVRPEAVEHLAGAVTELARAVREVFVPVADPAPDSTAEPTPDPTAEDREDVAPHDASQRARAAAAADGAQVDLSGSPRAARGADVVQRIEITD